MYRKDTVANFAAKCVVGFIRVIAVAIFALSILSAVVLFSLQCIGWLINARWSPLHLSDAVELFGFLDPYSHWRGLNIVLKTMAAMPLSISLIVIAFSFGSLILYVAKRLFKVS